MIWYWLLGIVGGLIVLIIAFALFATAVGRKQPVDHVVSRTLTLRQTPEAVWAVIADHAAEPSWQSHVQSVKRLEDKQGHEAWELKHKGMGNPPMILVTTEKVAPRRLVRTIDDTRRVFSGRWEFDLAATASGTRLTITEHGSIPNAFFRGMFKLFANPAMYLDKYLTALAAKFGEPDAIE